MTTNTPTPAGWYDDGQGATRWYDGQQWTDQTQPPAQPSMNGRASQLGQNLTSKHDFAGDPDTIWSAVGKPITGLGAGRYKLTEEYLFFEKGSLSTKAQQIRTHEIHDVDASQTMTQKARGVGTVVLTAQRTSGREIVHLEDIPNFREGVSTINRVAHEARERLRVRESTQHINYSSAAYGGHQAPPVAQQQAPAAGMDLNAELGKLAAFRDQGVLNEEEFVAAKRKMLGL